MKARFACIFLTVCVMACSSGDYAFDVNRAAPFTRFQLLNGEYVPLVAFEKKIVAILFWGSWCRHSRKALPAFAEIAHEVAGNGDIQFLAVSVDGESDADEVLALTRELPKGNLQHAFSGNEGQDEAFIAFQGKSVPLLFVIDEAGTVVAKGRSASVLEDYLESRGLLP